SRYLKEKNPAIKIIGVQPEEGESIPGIRRWPPAYLPKIFEPSRVDQIIDVSKSEALETMHKLATVEGIFAGVSSGGALAAALRLSEQLQDALIVTIVCDRGDRYISTGVYS
ncbi:MAG TPA: cysteine synthase B, partial [Gammaproteobacteria bacterium]|nr:cysteine synthase B [Gammaproteobacteria bacterium]